MSKQGWVTHPTGSSLFAIAVCLAFSVSCETKEPAQDPEPAEVKITDERTITKIALGSCANQNLKQPIWDSIVAAKPELFLFLGDNVYADTEDMEQMRATYAKLAAIPGYQKLRATCPGFCGVG